MTQDSASSFISKFAINVVTYFSYNTEKKIGAMINFAHHKLIRSNQGQRTMWDMKDIFDLLIDRVYHNQ